VTGILSFYLLYYTDVLTWSLSLRKEHKLMIVPDKIVVNLGMLQATRESRDSAVGIATEYWLDDQGSEFESR
jgi:hypothetical protein